MLYTLFTSSTNLLANDLWFRPTQIVAVCAYSYFIGTLKNYSTQKALIPNIYLVKSTKIFLRGFKAPVCVVARPFTSFGHTPFIGQMCGTCVGANICRPTFSQHPGKPYHQSTRPGYVFLCTFQIVILV